MNGGGSGAGLAVDGDLALLHRLEQRRLRLRRGPVDLVGEHDVGEQRARLEAELLGRALVDADADEVGGQQVGRELDALPACSRSTRPATWRGSSCRRPGTSSMSRWPSARRQMSAISIGSILPCTTCAMFAVTASNSAANRELPLSGAGSSPPAWRLGRTVTRHKRTGVAGARAVSAFGRGLRVARRGDVPGDRRRHRPARRGRRRRDRRRWSCATASPRRRATCGRRCTASCGASSPPAPTTPSRSSVCGVSCEGPIDAVGGTVSPLHLPVWQSLRAARARRRAHRPADRARPDGPGTRARRALEGRRPPTSPT